MIEHKDKTEYLEYEVKTISLSMISFLYNVVFSVTTI
jgi:hypothetical protein